MRLIFVFLFMAILFVPTTLYAQHVDEFYTLSVGERLNGMSWKPDGTQLLGWSDTAIYFWDMNTEEKISTRLEVEDSECLSNPDRISTAQVRWSHNQKYIICENSRQIIIQVWDAATGNEVFEHQWDPYTFSLVHWSPDETQVIVCCRDTFELWDIESGNRLTQLTLTTGYPSYNREGDKILIPTENRVHVWGIDADGFEETSLFSIRMNVSAGDFIARAVWSHDERKVIISTSQGYAEVWSLDPVHKLYRINLITYDNSMYHNLYTAPIFHWSPNDQYIYGYSSETLVVWDSITGHTTLISSNLSTRDYISPSEGHVQWSQKNRDIFYWLNEPLQIFDARNGKVEKIFERHNNDIFDVYLSSDEGYMMSWEENKIDDGIRAGYSYITFRDTNNPNESDWWTIDYDRFSMAYTLLSPDEQYIAGFGYHAIYLWKINWQ